MRESQLWQLLGVALVAGMPVMLLLFALLRRLGGWLWRMLPSRQLRAYPPRRRSAPAGEGRR